ncbi:MAG TPA: DUF3558 domain-containing protein [Pseudonocardiaceae bacterium]
MRPVIPTSALVIATVVLAGCATQTAGSARPANHAPPTTSSANFGAPKVTTPLDTTKYQANPCGTLTPAQLQALGITQPGKVTADPTGGFCDWSPQLDVVYTLGFNTTFEPGDAEGLANVYQIGGPNSITRLPDVHGQPAVTQPSQNTGGSCTIYLGATDVISYGIAVTIPGGQPHFADPCTVATQIADDATATMKSGG